MRHNQAMEYTGGENEKSLTKFLPANLDEKILKEKKSEWNAPNPILSELLPVFSFDNEALLPSVLGEFVADIADRMPCPLDFVAVSAMVALGSAIGARCAIKPKSRDDWLVVPNIWGAIVSPPSAKKSPAIAAAMKPLDRLIAKAISDHNDEIANYEVDKDVHEAKKKALHDQLNKAARGKDISAELHGIATEIREQNDSAPQPPSLRRFKTNDTTIEKLGELLRENPNGLLVLRDELVGLIASWEREGREGERAFFLEAWNGNSTFDTDRIGRGSIFIENLCVSIFGGIQPDKLVGYLEQATHALSNDGMLQRFQLLAYPDHRAWEWRDRKPNELVQNRIHSTFETIANFDPVSWGATPADNFAKVPYFRFSEAAQEIFIEWSAELHRTKLPAEDSPIIAQHLAKYDKLFPALALILHLVDCAADQKYGPVSEHSALRAAAWCEYLESHARRCYGLLADDGLRAAQALADKIKKGKLLDGFTARDVRRNQWRHLTMDQAVTAALDWLEDEHWLESEEVGGEGPGTGRRTTRYTINPLILKGAFK